VRARWFVPAGAAITALLAALPAAQPPDSGKALFDKRCGGCHALDRDKEGPRLGGVYGRRAGAVASFEYSDSLKKSGIAWTPENLDQWLTDTEKVVPGNDMTFRVEKAEERQAIIEWLKRK